MFKHITEHGIGLVLRSGAQQYDTAEVSRETGVSFVGEVSKTVQSSKDECDINVIVRRFGVTGQLSAASRAPSYGDFTGVNDFQTAMNVVRRSEEMFADLPSGVRKRFRNDPQEFMDFVHNSENLDEMVKLGLAIKRKDAIITPSADVQPVKEKSDARSAKERVSKSDQASRRSERDSGGNAEVSGGGD